MVATRCSGSSIAGRIGAVCGVVESQDLFFFDLDEIPLFRERIDQLTERLVQVLIDENEPSREQAGKVGLARSRLAGDLPMSRATMRRRSCGSKGLRECKCLPFALLEQLRHVGRHGQIANSLKPAA